MCCLCTLQVLLAKYSCQDDIVVGTPFANRSVPGTEGLLGCFVNTLAIRMSSPQNSSVAAALMQTKAAVTAAFAHGATPFAEVVNSIGAVRSASFAPIYQVSPADAQQFGYVSLTHPAGSACKLLVCMLSHTSAAYAA